MRAELHVAVAQYAPLKGEFAALMREKVVASLGLTRTFYDVPDAERKHYAQGHARDGRPVRVSPARTAPCELVGYVHLE